jgi:Family of unknown function (DUF5990)/Domain of unknown function (DUF5655)
MSQLSAQPGLLPADAVPLIDGQYADRPQLRPILDAVLAALPALGPVKVEARRTIVSLVSPRRAFAWVQATTRNHVDLGLRLDDLKPDDPQRGTRLQAAKNLGAATVRIALTDPGQLDDEALGWLRRAYEQSTAPPPPRRKPAPRPRPEPSPLAVVIEASDLPGRFFQPGPEMPRYRNMHVALRSTSKDRPALVTPGSPWRATEAVPGDAKSARWEVEVTIRRGADGLDFGGPFVRGDRTDRHIGLVWGDVQADGTFRLVRGSKFKLAEVDDALIEEAMRPGSRLVARVRLACFRSSDLTWSVVRALSASARRGPGWRQAGTSGADHGNAIRSGSTQPRRAGPEARVDDR